MNALFYCVGYNRHSNVNWRFAVTTPDGPHDRAAHVLDVMRAEYPGLTGWHVEFVCLTPERVFKEL